MRPEADVELRRAESSPAQWNHRRRFPIIRERDIYACPVRRSASRSLRPDEGNLLMPHGACVASSVFVQDGFVRSMGPAPAHSWCTSKRFRR